MSTLLNRLRERGWRVTAQRRAVAEALGTEHTHLTVEQVFDRARAILPEVSRATVYNTLNELVAMGEVTKVATGGRPLLYDANAVQSHQHLLCLSCGRLLDVDARGEDELRPIEGHGYEIVRARIIFEGYCPNCGSSHSLGPSTTDGKERNSF
jgi:Fe2+ or Zn2+ uptake regulation protein